MQRAPRLKPDDIIIVNLSGRGDKDVETAAKYLLDPVAKRAMRS